MSTSCVPFCPSSCALSSGPVLRNEFSCPRNLPSVSFCSQLWSLNSSLVGGNNSHVLRRLGTNADKLRSRTRPCRRCFSIQALVKGVDYEFFEEGENLEVRVPLPQDGHYTARFVAVDTQASSLCVGVKTPQGVKILLETSSLYGRIQPHETVWFVDETEVVLSLKKADREQVWPDLVQAWDSLAKGVAAQLQGASVYVVGESTELNWTVAQEIASGLGYVPLKTQQLIEDLAKAPASQITEEEGDGALALCEGAVLKTLSQHVRCVIATLGGKEGLASRHDGWNNLYSGFTVWLKQSQAQDEDSALEEVAKVKQEGNLGYSQADVVVALSGWDADAVQPTAEGALKALKQFLEAEKDLPGKKSLYVRLGCRGDWPDLMPPGWDPNSPQDSLPKAESMVL
ncbi:hypothetical protein R1flu_005500 [Riccia fluitans]|uniref:CS domain-containing protein n=1 Tax=Riccia fluitans TaxID=41844 RepID=A0ABD1YTC6_9MARC